MKGSYFPNEVYCFGNDQDNLAEFVSMLKNRGYYIGDDGHIRSPKGVIASKIMRNGYWMTSAQYNTRIYYFMEHRVIWAWHNGAIPNGLVINHKDYNKSNNNIGNLEIITQKENVTYSKCHQNPPRGEKSGKALFTNKQAEAVKALRDICGWKIKDIADFVGTNACNITKITKGQRYPDAVTPQCILEAYPTLVNFTRNRTISKDEEVKGYLLGLNGEVGEVTDVIKKIFYHGKEYNPVELLLELGDVLYYLVALCNVLNIDITEVLLNNNAKLMARYEGGYSVEKSINRIEDRPRKQAGTIDGNGDGISGAERSIGTGR